MRAKVFRLLFLIILLISIGYLAYRGYGWWQIQEQRKALFLYFKEKSPVTRKIPEDAFLYVNLYDFNRVHDDLQNTLFYSVLAHWLDTGLSDDEEANAMRGGMLEKSVLNIAGKELGLAAVPSPKRPFDLLAVAHIKSGSDLVLRLALAHSRQATKMPFRDYTIFGFPLKHPDWPEWFVCVDDDFAYASTELSRVQQALTEGGNGPAFLKNLDTRAIPEDTFLFLQSKEPELSLLAHGRKNHFRITTESTARINGAIPDPKGSGAEILRLETNVPEIIHHPAAGFILEETNGASNAVVFLQEQPGEGKELPLTFRVQFQREPVLPYLRLIEQNDWSRFPGNKGMYFLSCVREINGGIDGSQNEITLELE